MAGKKIGQAGEVFYAVAVAVSTLGNAMCASLASSRLDCTNVPGFCLDSGQILLVECGNTSYFTCVALIFSINNFFAEAYSTDNRNMSSTCLPRFLQAGGRQGILPSCFGLVNKRFKTPMFSILFVV